MTNEELQTFDRDDLTDGQRSKKYRCKKCGWIGMIDEMEFDTDIADEHDAVWGEFCCPNHGCWEWYSFLEQWEVINEN